VVSVIVVDEHLDEGAPIQMRLSHTHCADECAWYHGPRQYLRALGVTIGIGRDSEFLVTALAAAARQGHFERVLIPASADCGMLAHVIAAYRDAGAPLHVTFTDRCGTPIGVNTWYAELTGMPIETHHTDILDLTATGPLDVVCVHAFFGWFAPAVRRHIVRKWHGLLRPGGVVVTASAMRPRETTPTVRFTGKEQRSFMTRARQARNEARDRFGIDPDTVDRWAEDVMRLKAHHPTTSEDDVRVLFESEGFRVQQLFTVDGRSAEDPKRIRVVAERI
jgi:SAM-dependent methyltransferase